VPPAPAEGSDGVAARVLVAVALLLAIGATSRRMSVPESQKT
jgi:hypothetical protein